MIGRIWRGWTTTGNADAYQKLMTTVVIPAIEKRAIAGLLEFDFLRCDRGGEIEFTTILWFDTLEAIGRFIGEDHEAAHVTPEARKLLIRYDQRVAHHEVIACRVHQESSRGRC